jgi:hypothetical protein
MEMLGKYKKVRVCAGGVMVISEPFSANDYYHYRGEEYDGAFYDSVLEKYATSIDLEEMIIHCRG